MKNNYNPFTVPENFFETTCLDSVSRFRSRRRTILWGAAAAAVVVMLCIPMFVRPEASRLQDTELSANLANMYEYDIFLQVNFE